MLKLQLETLEIRYTDEQGASEKTFEEVCPGNPFIVFSAKPSVAVVLDNPLQRSGLFTINSEITNGETTKTFTSKITKIVGLKDVEAVRIWRHDDPILGPRKIPVFSEPFKNKIKLEDGTFTVDTEKQEVYLELEDATKINVGSSLIYVVE